MKKSKAKFRYLVWRQQLKETKHVFTKAPKHKRRRLSLFVLGLWALTIFMPKKASILRASYLWFRYVDDVIDHDRDCALSCDEFIAAKKQLIASLPDLDRLSLSDGPDLLIVHVYQACLRAGFDVQDSISKIFDTLEYDAERAKNHLVPTQAQLDDYFETLDKVTIFEALRVVGEEEISVDDLSGLNQATRIRYNLRDFLRDLEVKIINIPQEEVERYGIDLLLCRQANNIQQLLAHEPFRQWFVSQLDELARNLASGINTISEHEIKLATKLTLNLAFIKPCAKALAQWQKLIGS